VDVVDERNEPIGVIPRAEVFSAGVNFRTVHVLVFDHEGELLLQRLSPERERHPGLWGSSVAGYLRAVRDTRRRLTGVCTKSWAFVRTSKLSV
jgi:isopentenyldiphosphate isomerase